MHTHIFDQCKQNPLALHISFHDFVSISDTCAKANAPVCILLQRVANMGGSRSMFRCLIEMIAIRTFRQPHGRTGPTFGTY